MQNKPIASCLARPVKYALLILIFIASTVSSCTNTPAVKLNTLINKAVKSNNDVNESEWKDISTYILSEKNRLKEYITDKGQVDAAKLQQLINQVAARRRGNTTPPGIFKEKNPNEIAKRPHFNIYIENSMSMDGYVKGNTDFEAAITRLLIDISEFTRNDKKIHINFINSKIFPAAQVDIQNFATKLEPGSITYDVGGKARGVSDLNQVFKMTLDSTRSGIAVLISDCIYSLGKNNDTEGTLNIQKSLTMKHFLDKLRDTNLATICLKMVSGFTGLYYDKNNRPATVKDIARPYYIWLMGPKEELESFYSTIHPENDLAGYRNSFVLFPSTAEKLPFYTVLKETEKIGSFKSDRGSRDFVHSIYDIGYDNKELQFSVAIDISKTPADSSYILDKKNYQLNDGFTLTDIKKMNRNTIARRDWVTVEHSGATHLFTIKTTKDYSIQDLKLSLVRQIPAWVKNTHSTDDTNMLSNGESAKTFGLLHLIQGVNDAYVEHDPNQQSFFTITINIKK